jgi:hypothetical protein
MTGALLCAFLAVQLFLDAAPWMRGSSASPISQMPERTFKNGL